MRGSGMLPMKLNGRRDKEEESLVLFKELHKRENDRLASLLQPISDEFEPKGGSSAFYIIASGRKGSGYEFLGENNKNDYDWLKTPPATPLFPSLEMEANAQTQLAVQREIPILQPVSRFASNTEAFKGSTPTSSSPKSKPRMNPWSKTPVHVQRTSIIETKNHPQIVQKMSQLSGRPNKEPHVIIKTAKLTTQTNFSVQDSKSKTISRGLSPSIISRIPAQILGLSSDTPLNLRTNRAASATRGRPLPINSTFHQKSDANSTFHKTFEFTQQSRRQSCSPSMTRGRKEGEEIVATQTKEVQMENDNGTQIFGSRMVDRVLNARKLGAEEREPKSKPKPQTPTITCSRNNGRILGGFARTIPKTKNSQDMAPKPAV